jgi:aerobic-type carbon monoxide dehydrogenase small subunit (CoxS/CutS family)
MALCGAYTMHKNGKAIRSSITPINGAAGSCGLTAPSSTRNGLARKTWMLERTTETSLRSSPAPKLASESADRRC